MKNVMVLAVLFLSTVSILSSQTYASVSDSYMNPTEPVFKEKKNETITPPKTDSPIFITGSEFQSELTGITLSSPAKERVELLIESYTDKVYRVALFNQLGSELHTFDVPANSVKPITVEQYAAGSYYFLIYITDGSIKKKFKIVD